MLVSCVIEGGKALLRLPLCQSLTILEHASLMQDRDFRGSQG
jgi:hypothetical protein